jgi:hypothetical protein
VYSELADGPRLRFVRLYNHIIGEAAGTESVARPACCASSALHSCHTSETSHLIDRSPKDVTTRNVAIAAASGRYAISALHIPPVYLIISHN